MQLPVIEGIIRRRILANYSADPDVVAKLLPSPLRPKLAGPGRDRAVVGVCLIRLEELRPHHVPAALGLSSENAAHRIAVTFTDADGHDREGVYVPRRDTSSRLSVVAGGRLFPGEQHHADFDVRDDGTTIDLSMRARDGGAAVAVHGASTSELSSSLFASLEDASEFFRRGSLGYSARSEPGRLDGISLHTDAWKVEAMRVDRIASSFFDDPAHFPEGSIQFDFALVMRDIPHEWRPEPPLQVGLRPAGFA